MSQKNLRSKVNGLFIFLIVFLSIIYTFPRWADLYNQDIIGAFDRPVSSSL